MIYIIVQHESIPRIYKNVESSRAVVKIIIIMKIMMVVAAIMMINVACY